MHDMGMFRANLDAIAERLSTRGLTLPVEHFANSTAAAARHYRKPKSCAGANESRARSPDLRKEGADTTELQRVSREIGERIAALAKSAEEVDASYRELLAGVPNIPHESVPVGKSADDNVVVRTVGEPRSSISNPKRTGISAPTSGILDFERATKITGARFAVYWGMGAKLERALINFMLDTHTREHGYTEVLPPFLVNSASLYGTGQLPKFAEDLFKLEGHRLLADSDGRSAGHQYFRDETLDADALPINFCATRPASAARPAPTGATCAASSASTSFRRWNW
jgi:seryl-tRNA synthetase